MVYILHFLLLIMISPKLYCCCFSAAIPLLGHYHVHRYAQYEKKYENVLVLVTDHRVYFLGTNTENELNDWFKSIRTTLDIVRKGSKTERYDTCDKSDATDNDKV